MSISLKETNKDYNRNRIDEKGKRQATFNSYIKISTAIFSGEKIAQEFFADRKKRIRHIITRTVIDVEK